MKRIVLTVVTVISLVFSGTAFADDELPLPEPISAEQAFDAVQMQTDPYTGLPTNVVLVDVRTRAEYFWVGAACQVTEIITTDDKSIIPDYGKVELVYSGRFLKFKVHEYCRWLCVTTVSKVIMSPISINIPYKLWSEETATTTLNPNFIEDVEALAEDGEVNVIIFFCRSGGRSQDCLQAFDISLFEAIYEIDQPSGKSGRGGFEGTSYSNVYNGYRGYPGRFTRIQEHPSVSWKDAGLPVKTSVSPLPKP
jgi:rhodanese-related sulfurtransferase